MLEAMLLEGLSARRTAVFMGKKVTEKSIGKGHNYITVVNGRVLCSKCGRFAP